MSPGPGRWWSRRRRERRQVLADHGLRAEPPERSQTRTSNCLSATAVKASTDRARRVLHSRRYRWAISTRHRGTRRPRAGARACVEPCRAGRAMRSPYAFGLSVGCVEQRDANDLHRDALVSHKFAPMPQLVSVVANRNRGGRVARPRDLESVVAHERRRQGQGGPGDADADRSARSITEIRRSRCGDGHPGMDRSLWIGSQECCSTR